MKHRKNIPEKEVYPVKIRNYYQSLGRIYCPICKQDNIETINFDSDEVSDGKKVINITCRCSTCHSDDDVYEHEWQDFYTLIIVSDSFYAGNRSRMYWHVPEVMSDPEGGFNKYLLKCGPKGRI